VAARVRRQLKKTEEREKKRQIIDSFHRSAPSPRDLVQAGNPSTSSRAVRCDFLLVGWQETMPKSLWTPPDASQRWGPIWCYEMGRLSGKASGRMTVRLLAIMRGLLKCRSYERVLL
jgi:hypothetical protein